MSIKNNKTICGVEIGDLSRYSHKKIIKICDLCGAESSTQFKDYIKHQNTKLKYNTTKDYCEKCRYKIIPNANLGKSMSLEQRILLSNRAKARNIGAKYTKIIDGYAMDYTLGKQRPIHRINYEKSTGESLVTKDIIHHINLDTLDNKIDNLIKVTPSQHSQLHANLERLAGKLVQSGLITLDRQTLTYHLGADLLQKSIPISLGFEDIAIQQKENICSSRLDVNIETEIIRGVKRPLGLIASNMSTVTNAEFCNKLYSLGAFGIMHRAADTGFLINETKKIATQCEWVACSIGVTKEDIDLMKILIRAGANIITIDIAHGFSDSVFDMAKSVKNFSRDVKVIIGNTTNTDIFNKGLRYIDCVKLGIAQGLACETKNTAGCTEKQFSAILKFKQISRDLGIPIISDGSIREPADFTKAIGAGANSAMAGSIFARCPESAAELVYIDDKPKKLYAGMASRYVQEKWKGGLKAGTCPEGGVRYLDIGESIDKLLERYAGALKSGITYAGGKDIKSFQDNVEFVRFK
jgi:IMP dehydrogenase/GMP reductase